MTTRVAPTSAGRRVTSSLPPVISGRPSPVRHHVAVRGVLVGLVCGVGAVLAHGVAAGGHVATAAGLAVVLAGLAVGPVLALRPSLPRVAAVVVVLQLAAHASMALTGMPGGAHHGHAAMDSSPGSSVLAMLLDGGVPMLLGHLAAAAVTAVLARGADRALVALLADRLRALVLPPTAVQQPPQAPARTLWPRHRPLRSLVTTSTAGPRAPPYLRTTSPTLA